jgi:hypothetical protein
MEKERKDYEEMVFNLFKSKNYLIKIQNEHDLAA